MEQGGCLFIQSQEDENVWETSSEDSDSDSEEHLTAEIQTVSLEEDARRLLDIDFGDISDDESEFSPFEDVASTEEPKAKEPEPEKPPLFDAPIELGECPICYEELKMIDFTVTKCGHTFHSSCVFKALEQNLDCPMCRCQLLEVQEDEDEEDEDNEEGEDEEGEGEEDQEEEEEEDMRPTMEQLATKLQNMGYTSLDLLTLFMNGILKRQDETRQTDEFLETLSEKIDDIVDGKITMSHRDQRTYAQVVAPQPEPQPQQAQQVVRLKDLERIIRQGQGQQEVV